MLGRVTGLLKCDGASKRMEGLRRLLVIAARKTDYSRWRDQRSYNPAWAERLGLALSYLGDARWVVDLGCGSQDMRSRLPPEAIYLPMDLVKWTPDTLACDINAGSLPTAYIELGDVCFLLGVLEYVYQPDPLFSALGQHAEKIVLSYNAADLSSADRHRNGWVNAMSVAEVVALVQRHGFQVTSTGRYLDQILIEAVNPDFDDDRRARREEARRSFLSARSGAEGRPVQQKTGAP